MVVDYPSWLWRPILARILRSRPERTAEQYRAIWTEAGSPLERGTESIARALGHLLGEEVSHAFRYGSPSLRERLTSSRKRVALVPLFPQRTGSTTGSIESVIGSGDTAEILRIAPDDPGYIEAVSDLFWRSVDREAPEHLVVSFHGIPARYDRREGGTYRADCERTFRALLKRLAWQEGKATLSYQSRFGPEPWLRPATASVIARLASSGVRSIAVATPGFLTEGLETLEEIGIRGRRTFLEAGGERFIRVPAVESHPSFLKSLVNLVAESNR
jgi:ferrochelatase